MAEQIAKYFERGFRKLYTRKWDNEAQDYTGDPVEWNGHTAIEVSFNQEVTNLASGDDPAWDVLQGALTGDITVTFYDIDASQLKNLLNVTDDDKYGAIAGGDATPNYVGLMFTTTTNSGKTNKYVLFKCAFTMPDLSHETVSDEENAISELEVEGTCYPIWADKDGESVRMTYVKMNEENTGYGEFDGTIVKPTW